MDEAQIASVATGKPVLLPFAIRSVGARLDVLKVARCGSSLHSPKGCTAMPRLTGENHPHSKLTADDVLTIRKMYNKPGRPKVRELADQYGVSHVTIANIVNGESWTHLLPAHAHTRKVRWKTA